MNLTVNSAGFKWNFGSKFVVYWIITLKSMRFVKLVFVVLLFSAFRLSMAQSQPEPPVSQEINLTKSVHLFPNPATEDVFVELDHFPAENVSLTVHNIIGNELEVETEIVSDYLIRVRVKDLASGYYLLAVKDEESKFRGTYKFLKR